MLNKTNLSKVVATYILPIGITIFLTGLCIIESRSSYHSLLYIFIALPSLFITITNPSLLFKSLQSHAFKLVILLLVFATISTLWADDTSEPLRYIRYNTNIFLFILAFIYIQDSHKNLLIKILLSSAAVWAVFGAIELFNFYFIQKHTLSARIIGSGSLTNTLLTSHVYGAFAALLASYMVLQRMSVFRLAVLLVTFLVILIFIVQTHSRTPLLGLSAVFITLLLQYRNKQAVYFFVFVVLLAATYLTFNLELLTQRSFSYRPEIWGLALQNIINKPIIGHGLGSQMSIYIPSLKTAFSDSHNIHIGLMYDLGLLGLSLWLITLFFLFKLCRQLHNNHLIATGFSILIFGFFAGMTEGGGFFTRPKEVWFLIWLPIAILISTEINLMKYKKNVS